MTTATLSPLFTPTPTCGPTVAPPGYVIESGDYDGDGTSEIAIFRQSAGLWAVRELGRTYFGGRQDIPVPGDYDGDGNDPGSYGSDGTDYLDDVAKYLYENDCNPTLGAGTSFESRTLLSTP